MEKHIIVDKEVHQQAKINAAKEGKTLKDYIREKVSEDK